MKGRIINIFKAGMAVLMLLTGLPSVSAGQPADTNRARGQTAYKNMPPKPPQPAVQPHISEIIGFQINNIAPSDNVAEKKTDTLQDGSEITITISNPKDFLLQRPTDKSRLILYADGFPLMGMNTEYFTEIGRQYLSDSTKLWPKELSIPFIFIRDSSSKAAWNSLFHMAHWNKNRITFKMALGWSGMFPLNATTAKHVNTTVTVFFYTTYKFYLLCLLYIVFIGYFIYLCQTTGLIREPDLANSGPGPFSLAQTQLAFWTVIIIGGFVYLIILTGLTDSLNDSILLLLGISGGTTGAASFIDYYKKIALVKNQQIQQQPEGSTPPAAGFAVLPIINTKRHRSFLLDILSDGINISVQRTQTVLWNLVLGLYFIWFVITNKAMPEFTNTLLLLAGVSSLLYVGSKGPEYPVVKS